MHHDLIINITRLYLHICDMSAYVFLIAHGPGRVHEDPWPRTTGGLWNRLQGQRSVLWARCKWCPTINNTCMLMVKLSNAYSYCFCGEIGCTAFLLIEELLAITRYFLLLWMSYNTSQFSLPQDVGLTDPYCGECEFFLLWVFMTYYSLCPKSK